MAPFNPGALRNIARYSAPQTIVPGSDAFDNDPQGGVGIPRPAVGQYPTGAPRVGYGLADDAAADATSPSMTGLAIFAVGGILIWYGWLGDKVKRWGRK